MQALMRILGHPAMVAVMVGLLIHFDMLRRTPKKHDNEGAKPNGR